MGDKLFLLHEKNEDTDNDSISGINYCWHTKLNKIDTIDYIKSNDIKTKQSELEKISTPFIGLEKHKQYYIDYNNLSDKECNNIIEKFENDLRKTRGMTGSEFVNLQVKDTIEVLLTGFIDWLDIDRMLYSKLTSAITEFKKQQILDNIPMNPLFDSKSLVTDGFQIQKYEKGSGKYIWHSDNLTRYRKNINGKIMPFTRIYTYIWYLNDIEEGGETMFLHDKIKPKKGKLLLFPSTWDNIHCGNYPISDNKYIITGWISCNTIGS
jgi:hypothetical protein